MYLSSASRYSVSGQEQRERGKTVGLAGEWRGFSDCGGDGLFYPSAALELFMTLLQCQWLPGRPVLCPGLCSQPSAAGLAPCSSR